jgi:hypothetical protein
MIIVDDALVSATSPSPEDLFADPAFASLWRGILLIEPNRALLAAEALLLTHSDYSVTPVFSHDGVFAVRRTKAIMPGVELRPSLERRHTKATLPKLRLGGIDQSDRSGHPFCHHVPAGLKQTEQAGR